MNNKISVRTICQVSILVALEIVLSRFCSINTFNLKIGFGFVPIALCAILFGPVWAMVAHAMSDFLGAMLFPIGPYFPGFTFTAALTGLVFGLCLHRDNVKFFPHIVCAAFICCVILSLGVNTCWICVLYGKAYMAMIPPRILQCAVTMAAQLVFLPLLIRLSKKLERVI